MHELSVCLALMQQVERVCREHSARRVALIRLQVGPLSGVEPPLLERARVRLRQAKQWAEADAIREQLDAQGIVIMDGPEGSRWRVRLDAPAEG